MRALTVDASQPVGMIKSLTGIVGNPDLLTSPAAMAYARQIGITTWRTHDTGAIDLMSSTPNNPDVIFPDQHADPRDHPRTLIPGAAHGELLLL